MPTAFFVFLKNFLEVVLLIGIFFGVSKDLNLKKEKDILIAALFGICLSLFTPGLLLVIGARGNGIVDVKSIKVIESLLFIFTPFVFLLIMHVLRRYLFNTKKIKLTASNRSSHLEFDLMLFFTLVIFLLIGESEMGYFSSEFSSYSMVSYIMSLSVALIIALVIGILMFASYKKFDVIKVLKVNNYALILFVTSISLSGFGMLVLR